MTDERAASPTVQIALRISSDLRDRIKAKAVENNRSVNSELTATLEEKYPKSAPTPVIPIEKINDVMNFIDGSKDSRELTLRFELANQTLWPYGFEIRWRSKPPAESVTPSRYLQVVLAKTLK